MRKEARGWKILLAFCCLAGVAAAIPSSVMALDDYAIGEKCWKEGRYRDAYSHLWRYRETPYGRWRSSYQYVCLACGQFIYRKRHWQCNVANRHPQKLQGGIRRIC